MAAVVYGTSPRHGGSRHHHPGSGQGHMVTTPHSPYHQQQPQQHHSLPPHHSSASSMTAAAAAAAALSQQIITPPTSYLSTSTTTISSVSHQQTIYYQQQQQAAIHYHNMRNSKRKSAVEMLAESKPFYVKSETVLDRQQQLSMRSGGSGPVSGSYMLSPSRALPQSICALQQTSHHSQIQLQQQHHHQQQQQQRPASRRSASSGSDLLQTKLRKLLNTADSKETIIPSDVVGLNSKYGQQPLETSYISGAGLAGNDCLGYIQPPKNYQQQLTVHPEQPSDMSVFFPSAFLSPQSLPPHPSGDEDLYLYGVHDSLVLTDDYRAISPPAEYAENNVSPEKHNNSHSRYNYQRSYSHSQAVAHQDESDYSPTQSYNINSHKSLPDLHSQISRHSPHSEALSCCSRGNRSNRSGSSFNRDSGGSSGHYTHHSEPCCKQQQQQQLQQKDALLMGGADYRRDSGSSTQHSGNSYYAYGIPPLRYDCIECRAKIREEADCLLNFTTPEVPEAFQDDYSEKQKQKYYDEVRDRSAAAARKYYKNHGPMSPLSPVSPLSPQDQQLDLSPPLGTFKRQKCLRFKNRGRQSAISNPNSRCGDGRGSSGGEDDRRPILRSKSDISDRYWNRLSERNDREREREREREQQKILEKQRSRSDSLTQLEHFFDRLGLNDETYERYIAPSKVVAKAPNYRSNSGSDIHRLSADDTGDSDESSAVFFSDVSTIDSTRLPDSTEIISNEPPQSAPGPLTSLNNPAMYRPSEPPSIIERNARIIKWLCNCKKMQLT
ncbi:uncharacterized protein LOC131693015 [Topomyia yanbarensis]|uniref:uncharacterized protein LOC131693015 n=1 Tax=Topomyia yanbarensis TaxID=2498891 RepID=UPI00273C9FDF|nr:uncharacterized protein LOC131693015 [Topomyia yanbarensis]XP_058836446.1 uncharacterized protein LOC131693015 [Topomyia yanbarensis]XP_058836447.1 uncharacterized protein LOC131693015 [Topomyia yanbarensis]XP_058836448.1 uncharacterized protein LOC131693015 [Topomyia yanbarensis]XP_058836449.1 uncharacterized protein LOC131693015 [Topomyia yanbarensis]